MRWPYMEEVRELTVWCQDNNLSLNVSKTKELIVYYRKRRAEQAPINIYSCTIESILTGCITAWYGNCSASARKALQRVVRTAQYITGAKLPAIQDLYNRKTHKIVRDSSHPTHRQFSLLPHGKRCRSAKSRTKRLLNSFYPQAISLLNN